MILINKSIFDNYFIIKYEILKKIAKSDNAYLTENTELNELIEKQNIELDKIKKQIKKLLEDNFDDKSFDSNRNFQLIIIYNENDDGGYFTRDEYKSDIISTNSLSKLYYHLLFNLLDEKMFYMFMNQIRLGYVENDIPNSFNDMKDINIIDNQRKYIEDRYTLEHCIFQKLSDENDEIKKSDFNEFYDILYKFNKTDDDKKYLDDIWKCKSSHNIKLYNENDNYDLLELLKHFFSNFNVNLCECAQSLTL